jgi:hypothetical protein
MSGIARIHAPSPLHEHVGDAGLDQILQQD